MYMNVVKVEGVNDGSGGRGKSVKLYHWVFDNKEVKTNYFQGS